MIKLKGYNRNLVGGKRPHKKITRFGHCQNLSERLMAESAALVKYQKRVGQYPTKDGYYV